VLTRLKVSGFKNLVDVDIRFGTFTCIAGANGVGKSNLFDAIRFLSALADRPFIEAALSIRDEEGKTGDIQSIFHRIGDEYASQMSFEAEMIISNEGIDDLGQKAEASITFLRYSLKLAYREDNTASISSLGSLELIEEKLTHINLGDAKKNLLFEYDNKWLKSAIKGRRGAAFISTEDREGNRIVKLHQDDRKGKPLSRLAANLPRTVLSVANAAETPTALLVRREMQSWRLLQLEPSSLRKPDDINAPEKLGIDGSHLPATLYRLARLEKSSSNGQFQSENETRIYRLVSNRLAELLDDIAEISIDYDERRKLLTLTAKNRDDTIHPAKSLSDGTLRFLALVILELDPEAKGVLCLEEPENGIHPERIPKILKLLQDIATDVEEPLDLTNPLRQVIVNTHSPTVVQQVHDDSLLVAELKETISDSGKRFKRVCFSCLPNTWRDIKKSEEECVNVVSRGVLLAYLNPVTVDRDLLPDREKKIKNKSLNKPKQRVIDREDFQPLITGFTDILI
jgi:predicted ATPase